MVIIAAAEAAALAVSGGVLGSFDLLLDIDGRSNPRPRTRLFSIRQNQFVVAEADGRFSDGWFRDQFRCTKFSFNHICDLIDSSWLDINPPINYNAYFLIRDRVAVTMYYLIHSGSVADAAKVFGMSKSSADRHIWQVIDVIITCLMPRIVKVPETAQEGRQIAIGFEDICGFPNACFAVDGCLFEIKRPHDYEGWYRRKGWPAINAQIAVDHRARFISHDFRPGSANNESIWNYSKLKDAVESAIFPAMLHGIADAGYALTNRMMTPYPLEDQMSRENSRYNYLHSKTRITVERALGMLKNRFRIFEAPLNQKADSESGRSQVRQMCRVIEACLVLHNILIDLADEVNETPEVSDFAPDAETEQHPAVHRGVDGSSELKRDQIRVFLLTNDL